MSLGFRVWERDLLLLEAVLADHFDGVDLARVLLPNLPPRVGVGV